MAWINLFADLRALTAQVKRLADTADRAYPVPIEGESTEPTVDYYDEQKAALQEALDELKRRGEMPADAELPEEENVQS